MRKCIIDNKQVIAPNASLLAGRSKIVKRGDCFMYNNGSGGTQVARSLGRIASVENDGLEDVAGLVAAMVLSTDATHAYERWIDPKDILEVYESPAKLAAFFFAPELPYDAQTMRDLMNHGTVCERYVDGAADRAKAFKAA